jgi:nucleotide-binding universal stress UspA family protein
MKIIIGVDDSTCSKAAIRYVARAPWPRGSRFIVVSAAAPILAGPGEFVSPVAIEHVLAEHEERYRKIAGKAAAELRKAGLSVDTRVVRGDPRSMLEEEARKKRADLIVIGSHGWTGIKKILLGSVASHVVSHAPCSVLVVKMPHRRRARTRSVAAAARS